MRWIGCKFKIILSIHWSMKCVQLFMLLELNLHLLHTYRSISIRIPVFHVHDNPCMYLINCNLQSSFISWSFPSQNTVFGCNLNLFTVSSTMDLKRFAIWLIIRAQGDCSSRFLYPQNVTSLNIKNINVYPLLRTEIGYSPREKIWACATIGCATELFQECL